MGQNAHYEPSLERVLVMESQVLVDFMWHNKKTNSVAPIFKPVTMIGNQNSVAVTCPHCNDNDVGPNLDATRNEKRTEASPMV